MSAPVWHRSLAARHALAMLACVAGGSILLLAWLGRMQHTESASEAAALAKNHADFVRRLNLPRSARLAGDLRELLGLDIYFRSMTGALDPMPGGDLKPALMEARTGTDWQRLPDGRQALALSLDETHDMIFVRAEPPLALSLRHPVMRHALPAFWLLAALMAWLGARQVVRPLTGLTRMLPGFFSKDGPMPAEAARQDEIGLLARALSRARADLHQERRRREESERLALLGRVATGLAHEIKNPLASIQLHAQLLDSASHNAETASSLKHVIEEARVIEGLVNQWLFLARPSPPEKAPLELRGLLCATLDSVRLQARHAGVRMNLEPGPEVTVPGDRVRLGQAFRNVILNAIQAMPGGGLLSVRLQSEGTHARLVFHDSGPGFSRAALQQATGLFYSEKEGGMGVGLNVVEEIVSAHQGSLRIKNHPKGGAVVELELPCGADGDS
ncbi:MAG TPA: HAMP domain-containing sensor histidine kinase [Prosthecobacter sp.]|nr:HAMP domain-containing sensor histidine kinase [Prosthecobacter sp.]